MQKSSICCKILIFLTVIGGLQSCNFGDVNVNPNATTNEVVSLDKRLPSLEYDFASIVGGSVAVRVGNIVGYSFYKQGPVGFNKYIFSPADASNINLWGDLYAQPINQAFQIIAKADEEGNNFYKGIALIIQSYSIITATTIWGDVPFAEASQASQFPFPKFDPQEAIYAKVQENLDLAIANLSNETGKVKPSVDDLIFKGDVSKWIKTAYALKARYYLHLVKKDVANYAKADVALANAFKSNADNCLLVFEEGVPDVNAPLYNEKVSGDTQVDSEFGTLLRTSLKDPREKFYTIVKGSIVNPSQIRALYGAFYGSKGSYYPFITYEECEFMRTEILMKTSGKAAAEPAFRAAIQASLDRICTKSIGTIPTDDVAVGIPSSVLGIYVNKVANIDSVAEDSTVWKTIFQQKFIAMFMQAEAWNDYRRTEQYVAGIKGLPIIKPRDGGLLPRKYYYPSTELNANPAAPPNIPDPYQRVWWDSN